MGFGDSPCTREKHKGEKVREFFSFIEISMKPSFIQSPSIENSKEGKRGGAWRRRDKA
jgi:hypothetical protein